MTTHYVGGDSREREEKAQREWEEKWAPRCPECRSIRLNSTGTECLSCGWLDPDWDDDD